MKPKGKGFAKFTQQKLSGAKLKEQIRQEKKKAREEKNEFFEQKKRERAALKSQQLNEERGYSAIERKAPRKRIPLKKEGESSQQSFSPKSYGSAPGYDRSGQKNGYSQQKKSGPYKKQHTSFQKEVDQRGYNAQPGLHQKDKKKPYEDRRAPKNDRFEKKESTAFKSKEAEKTERLIVKNAPVFKASPINEPIPLNKFIAHAGVCSRRDAAELVKTGKVQVNGVQVTEPGFKVTDQDEIKFNGKKLSARKNLVYILLNKPKDYITTTEDPQGRKTVLDLVKNATTERIFPIGRLDRNTTGVLLLTNDGELAQKLSHPSHEVKKIYEVKLDKAVTKADFDQIANGLTLEDGFIAPDALAYPDPKDRSIIGIEIHSGKNRIVRRIFEHLGYDVRNLDRVMYADLTKKNVDRGRWRFLSEKEVRLLKFLNKSYTKKKSVARD